MVMTSTLQTLWYKDLDQKDPEAKKARLLQVENWTRDPTTLLFLNIILQDLNIEDTPADDPNWVIKQAYVNGQRRLARKIKGLVSQ
jgi:hypothetical protein